MTDDAFDIEKLKQMIKDYFMDHLDDLAVGFMRVLAREFAIDQVAMRTLWLQKALRDIVILEPVIEGNRIYCNVGWDYNTEYELVRVLVGLYGSGDQAEGGTALHSKPGQMVWDKQFVDPKQESKATNFFYLHTAFNRPGNDALEKAVTAFEPIYDEQLQELMANMPINEMILQCM